MKCRICEGKSDHVFTETLLNKHQVKFYHCQHCHFLQTEEPYWLDEAYSQAITLQDTGLVQRNLELAKKTSLVLFYLFDKKKKFLDYAGGYGIFVRLMRDVGFDFYLEDKFCENLVARGFNGKEEKYELITSFESFEHFPDPISEIKELLKKSNNILFTTELMPDGKLPKNDWWYYSKTSGQHISFYSQKTLKFIAKKFGLKFYTNGFLHLLCKNEPELKTSDLFIFTHLLKQKLTLIFYKIIGKKKKISNNEIFYHLLKTKVDRRCEITKILTSKTFSDHENLV